jgi:hypothetical protein
LGGCLLGLGFLVHLLNSIGETHFVREDELGEAGDFEGAELAGGDSLVDGGQ